MSWREESNPQQTRYKRAALPIELRQQLYQLIPNHVLALSLPTDRTSTPRRIGIVSPMQRPLLEQKVQFDSSLLLMVTKTQDLTLGQLFHSSPFRSRPYTMTDLGFSFYVIKLQSVRASAYHTDLVAHIRLTPGRHPFSRILPLPVSILVWQC